MQPTGEFTLCLVFLSTQDIRTNIQPSHGIQLMHNTSGVEKGELNNALETDGGSL